MKISMVTAAALAAVLVTGAAAEDSTQTQADAEAEMAEKIGDVGALYPDEGADVTYDYCASCHSTMLIAQQGQTREDWDDLLVWMVEKQGMQPIPEEDREIVLDYLAEHYNTDRPHFP